MSKIKINKIEEDKFNVEVIDRRTSFHKVTITDKVHKDLTGGFVSKIQLAGVKLDVAEGGEVEFINPWEISDEGLTVISYTYSW